MGKETKPIELTFNDDDLENVLDRISKYNYRLKILVNEYQKYQTIDANKLEYDKFIKHFVKRNECMEKIREELESYYKTTNEKLDKQKSAINFTIKHLKYIMGLSFINCSVVDYLIFGTGYIPISFLGVYTLTFLILTIIILLYKGLNFDWEENEESLKIRNHAFITSLLPCLFLYNFLQLLLMVVSFYITMMVVEFFVKLYFVYKK